MTEDFMTVEDALLIVWDLANQNVLTEGYTMDDPGMEDERIKQETALNVTHDFMVNVVSEDRVQEIEPIRDAPKGTPFMTLFSAYLFESPGQFSMYDEGETDLRAVVDNEYGSPVALLAWNRRSGFPTPQDFEKFHREVAEELGDIPFVD